MVGGRTMRSPGARPQSPDPQMSTYAQAYAPTHTCTHMSTHAQQSKCAHITITAVGKPPRQLVKKVIFYCCDVSREQFVSRDILPPGMVTASPSWRRRVLRGPGHGTVAGPQRSVQLWVSRACPTVSPH